MLNFPDGGKFFIHIKDHRVQLDSRVGDTIISLSVEREIALEIAEAITNLATQIKVGN